jgi:hypothetical protein
VNCAVLCIICVDCVVLCIVCVLMCTVLQPSGVNTIAVKYIITHNIISYAVCTKVAIDLFFSLMHFAFLPIGIILLLFQTHQSPSPLQTATIGALEPEGTNLT